MGVVYLARDTRLERDVAIKFLPQSILADDAGRRRFRKEALALAKLNHPNIAAVYDVGQSDGAEYLVMEYVAGQSLAEKLKRGPLPEVDALSIGAQVAAALEEAHEHGVVHRDLKPANIVVTPKGTAKVLDFGLAKLIEPADPEATQSLAQTRELVGTILYMSPEQAEGKDVDSRSDLWSLGVVLYESTAGRVPFDGDSAVAVLRAIASEKPKPLHESRPETSEDFDRIVEHALERDVAKRYQSASEMSHDLSSALIRRSGGDLALARPKSAAALYAVAAAVLVILLAAGGFWFHRAQRRRWAREEALPKVNALLAADKPLAAFVLLKQVQQILPGDPQAAQIAADRTEAISVQSSPPGASVQIEDYFSPGSDWYSLGVTPLNNVMVPKGYFRWRVYRQGVGEFVAAPPTLKQMNFALDAASSAPPGMVRVEGHFWGAYIGFVGMVGPYRMPAFYADRDEVTNREYQEFVDRGGYQGRAYWKEPLLENGRELSWDEARNLFRDSTGRPGPSTWKGGHYPEGEGDYPVSGVSWYEAAAYAAYVGKSLPTLSQWYTIAPPDAGRYIVRESNISLAKAAPAGSFAGLGPYGTYDTAGNVREWVENDTGEGRKFILGGMWSSPTYLYSNPEALPPLDRSAGNGIRCVRNTAELPEAMTGAVHTFHRDFANFKPASDDVYHAYQALYAYDKTPLNAKVEGVVQDTNDWREEKVTFDAAYNGERMTAYLFLPKQVKPPFQAVVFCPSARVLDIPNSRNLGDIQFFDYVVQSGRAVIYPVYKGTYERQQTAVYPGAAQNLEYLTERYKDLARSLDYLQTRPDIDSTKLAYLGVSMGSAEGVIYSTLAQERLKAVIFLDGGYFLETPPNGGDQADFAPRLKKPVLMVNGRSDYVFTLETSQNPLFDTLGTPAADKRHVLLDSGHDVTEHRPELVQAVLDWLDKYLGRVD